MNEATRTRWALVAVVLVLMLTGCGNTFDLAAEEEEAKQV